jgi:haloalkane dehalogenase
VTIFSDRDVVAPTGYIPLVERVRGAKGQPHVILEGGGHFLQEDIPEAFNTALLDWMASTPSRVPA